MTHATFLWLGQAIGAAALSILQAATTGALVLTNLIYDPSQGTPAVYVGAQQIMLPAAAGQTYVTNGSQTGVVLKDQLGGTQAQMFDVPFTLTGGTSANSEKISGAVPYNTAIVANPLGGTGTVKVSIECARTGVNQAFNVYTSFVKGTRAGSGTAIANVSQVSVGTGSRLFFGSGGLIWNGADYLKVNSLTKLSGSVAPNCVLRVDAHHLYGQ